MDSVENILGSKNWDEPSELKVIKQFIVDKYQEKPVLKIVGNSLIIQVSNSALASMLRMDLHVLEEKIKRKYNLVIQIRK